MGTNVSDEVLDDRVDRRFALAGRAAGRDELVEVLADRAPMGTGDGRPDVERQATKARRLITSAVC